MRLRLFAGLLAGASLFVGPSSVGQPAVTSTFGVVGPSFAGTTVPTGTKRSESVVWWNDGSWWASMWSVRSHGFHIFRFAPILRRWLDTGSEIDRRADTEADTIWDGRHLYVATHKRVRDLIPARPGPTSYLYRFSYSHRAHRYTLDAGFPAVINHERTETLVIAKDTTGRLWATWQQGRRIYVTYTSAVDQRRWATPTPLPFPQAATTVDDISAVVAFSRAIGIMWSNQDPALDAMYFSVHQDEAPPGSWAPPEQALSGARAADDHINLKADSRGVVYAAVKTSSIHSDPLTLLLVRDQSGSWSSALFGTASECHNRPVIVLDERRRLLHMFATGPEPGGACTSSGGAIYEKTTALDAIVFPPGQGQLVLADPNVPFITNVSTSKQNPSAQSGLLVLAVNLRTFRYRTFYSR